MYGKPFVEMIQAHPQYGPLINVKATFEVKLVYRESHHWYLLIKTKESALPYISLEIRTTNLSDLVPFTREVGSPSKEVLSDVGVYEGTLSSLCGHADSIVKEMSSYDLLTSNCQTFCNKLLNRIGKPEFPATTEFLDREFDLLHEALVGESSFGAGNQTVSGASSPVSISTLNQPAAVSESLVGAVNLRELEGTFSSGFPPLSVDDLTSLKPILIPIRNSWRDIGDKLFINPQILQKIENTYPTRAEQCLREMLREYLQRTDPPPSWKELVDVVMEHDENVAKSIVRRAKRIPV